MSVLIASQSGTGETHRDVILPFFPASRSLWAFRKKVEATCGWPHFFAKKSGGMVQGRFRCNLWRCEFCGRRRADDVWGQIRTGVAQRYFSADFPIWSVNKEGIVNSAEYSTWVTRVEAYMTFHDTVKGAVSDRANKCQASFFTVSTTDDLFIFSDHDLSRPANTGKRGRPAGPPHDGVWIEPLVAGKYIRDLLNCGDVEKVTNSRGWPVIQTRKTNNDGEFKRIGKYSEKNTDIIHAVLRLVVARQLGEDTDFAAVLGSNPRVATVFKNIAGHVFREMRRCDLTDESQQARIAAMVDGSPLGWIERKRWTGTARCFGIGAASTKISDVHALRMSPTWSRGGGLPLLCG